MTCDKPTDALCGDDSVCKSQDYDACGPKDWDFMYDRYQIGSCTVCEPRPICGENHMNEMFEERNFRKEGDYTETDEYRCRETFIGCSSMLCYAHREASLFSEGIGLCEDYFEF